MGGCGGCWYDRWSNDELNPGEGPVEAGAIWRLGVVCVCPYGDVFCCWGCPGPGDPKLFWGRYCTSFLADQDPLGPAEGLGEADVGPLATPGDAPAPSERGCAGACGELWDSAMVSPRKSVRRMSSDVVLLLPATPVPAVAVPAASGAYLGKVESAVEEIVVEGGTLFCDE
mmetsp:Transcript_37955/g.95111  ORF Transcript_37955/g.95111 Transcript_37955/m.95111 type:complete len:171 (-) Transcript_37955:818-1330(-)